MCCVEIRRRAQNLHALVDSRVSTTGRTRKRKELAPSLRPPTTFSSQLQLRNFKNDNLRDLQNITNETQNKKTISNHGPIQHANFYLELKWPQERHMYKVYISLYLLVWDFFSILRHLQI